jgi:choline dehydrogenase
VIWGAVDLALKSAAEALGYGWCDDHNAPTGTGASPYAINSRNGTRVSVNDGYLEPARERANLTIVGDALVDTLSFEGNRPSVNGVCVLTGGEPRSIRVVREVILSAGAIHSPAILQRSGIGPASLLARLGVPIMADLPVGENLLDHPILGIRLLLKPAARVPAPAHRHTNCCLRYSSGLAGAGENDMMMIALNLRPESEGGTARGMIAVWVNRAFSQGSVRITTTDPETDPEVNELMLSHESDLVRMRDGIRRLRQIGLHAAVSRIAVRVEYGLSGRSIEDALAGYSLDEWMLAECSDAQHASGTCRMGDTASRRSVVDPACRVLGVSGLRVIDASVMPEVVRANTHLTTVMIAEKMADAIKAGQ